jgi:hypothetical protein
MTLLSKIEYETKINNIEDISPESILYMLLDIKESICNLDPPFSAKTLNQVLKITESGKYRIYGHIFDTTIDLSYAKSVIDYYRKNSEGGCTSCINRKIFNIHKKNDSCCKIYDSDYHILNEFSSGQTKKIRNHFNSPCKNWTPYFSPKIEELINKK